MNPSSLIGAIRSAFDTGGVPAPDPITEPGCCAECDALSSFLSRHDPESLEAVLLAASALEIGALDPSYLLTPQAFHYFLPAYLLASLRSFIRSADPSTLLEPTFSLAPGLAHHERLREYRPLFTPDQAGAIASYLSFCASHLEAGDGRGPALAHALDAIWTAGA